MNIQLHNSFCRSLGIEVPILLAGMAGGPATPELAAAVSKAGGLGTLGAAYMTPEEIDQAIRQIRSMTDRPFAVNLFVPCPEPKAVLTESLQNLLNQIRREVGLKPVSGDLPLHSETFHEQFAVLLDHRVPVISSAFGILPEQQLKLAHEAGAKVVTMVTSIREAILAERSGCDFIVAQGYEAGGHRGTFVLDGRPEGIGIGTLALVPQISDRVRIPVVAAGGIMDGRGLVASLVLGAQGVQLGTRFLTAAESGAHPAYQAALSSASKSEDAPTVITRVFSGRPARGIRNRFVEVMEASPAEPLPFPLQNDVTRDIRKAAANRSDAEYMSLWAGQNVPLIRTGETAAGIIQSIVREAEAILNGS